MADTAGDLARLKSLLLQPESRQLEVLQQQVRALDARVGTRSGLESSTSEVLVAAFRRAETHEHRELARAVAPVVVAAIQSEIRNSRDMMVEALYPITGRLVAAAVADAFRTLVVSINERVDTMMSMRLWRLRVKSWLTRRPLSELLLAEATRPLLKRILFLERGSGAVVADWASDPAGPDNSDLVSGMIAAITEFSRNVFEHESGELRTIDMGASRILLHATARSIVAGEIAGPLQPRDESEIHARLASLAELHNDMRPVEAGDLAEAAADIGKATGPEEVKKSGSLGIWIVAGALIAAAAWFGWRTWTRSAFESGIREAVAATVSARPALQAYPVRWSVDHSQSKVHLSGLAPMTEDAQALRAAIVQKAGSYEVAGDIAIVASQQATQAAMDDLRRANESLRAALSERTQTLATLREDTSKLQRSLNAQQPELAALYALIAELRTALQEARGEASRLATGLRELQDSKGEAARLAGQLQQLQDDMAGPRVRAENFMRRNAVFFDRDAVLRDAAAAAKVADELARLLRAANAGIRIVGYSSDTGSNAFNQRIGQERVRLVAEMLTERGIAANRIVTVLRAAVLPIDGAADAPGHPNRRVEFEPLLDNERPAP